MKRLAYLVLSLAMLLSTFTPVLASEATDICENRHQEKIEVLAYLSTDEASPEMEKEILSARKEIIFSKSWVADGVKGYVTDENGNIIEELPKFSDIFPEDWAIPYFDDQQESADVMQNLIVPATNAIQDDIMQIYNGTLTLSIPFATANTPPFCSCRTSGTVSGGNYYLSYIATYATSRIGSFGTFTSNIGYTNKTTGSALAWRGEIPSGKGLTIKPPKGVEVSIRASMNSSVPSIDSGNWEINSYGGMIYY